MSFLRPRALSPGASLTVVAPASGFPVDDFKTGLGFLAERYSVHHSDGLFTKTRYLAGPDGRRLNEIRAAFGDASTQAVMAARGGYGTMRLLQQLSWDPRNLKPLIGFSDLTALHAAANRAGWVTLHAPVVTQFGRQPVEVRERLFHWLEREAPPAPLTAEETFVGGKAEGVLLGGNLSVFCHLLGSPYLPSLEGALLLLEDVGERPYRLDRLWTQLELSGAFSKISGLVLGTFTACEEPQADYTSRDVLRELAQQTRIPCAFGFPIGHGSLNYPVALGARVRMDADARTLHFLEGAVRQETAA